MVLWIGFTGALKNNDQVTIVGFGTYLDYSKRS